MPGGISSGGFFSGNLSWQEFELAEKLKHTPQKTPVQCCDKYCKRIFETNRQAFFIIDWLLKTLGFYKVLI